VITVLLLLIWVAVGVFLPLLVAHEFTAQFRAVAGPKLSVGDRVIYRRQKVSTNPGPRAYAIHPTAQGDDYTYFVDKFWTVENVLRDGRILALTRTGKHHCLNPDDPNLRKAGIIVKLRYRNKFPELLEAA
jgi:hypothetical protein